MIHHLKRIDCPNLTLLLGGFFAAAALVGASPPPIAIDDHAVLDFGNLEVNISHGELKANDIDAHSGTVSLELPPIHGYLEVQSGSFRFQPNDDFWAVGSDLLVYRLDTPSGTSYATLYFSDRQRRYVNVTNLGFDVSGELPYDPSSGLSIETVNPVAGEGSLAVNVAEPTKNVSLTVKIPDSGNGQSQAANAGELDACAGGLITITSGNPANSAASGSDEVAGYLLLLGGEQADIHTASVRVGVTRGDVDFFVEARDSGAGWQRSAILDRGNEIVRFNLSFAEEAQTLAALLRVDGLAVRSPVVTFDEDLPTHAHLGFFQPPDNDGSTADLFYDLVHLGSEYPDSSLIDTGRLLVADNFEDGTFNAWRAVHGNGLAASTVSSLSGALGLDVTGLPGSKSYASFQARPLGETSDPRFQSLTARSTVDIASLNLDPGYPLAPIAIQSGDDPIFGAPVLRALVIGGASHPHLRLYAYHDGDWSTSELVPAADVSTLELQAGRADAPGLANGWARLWVDGEVILELFGLENYDRRLRNVHFGAEGYQSSSASGTLRHDDVTVTR